MSQVTERYTIALFSLAKEEDKVKEFKQELKTLLSLFDAELLSFLKNRNVAKDIKKDLMQSAFKDYHIYIVNFINLLIDKGRINLIKDIFKSFIKMANNDLNIQEATVISAHKLDDGQFKEIEKALKIKLNSEVELVEKIDETLIAGFKVYVGHEVYDASFKRRIDKLKDELMKESW